MKKKVFRIICVVVWMMVIFYFSNQPADISKEQSGFFVNLLSFLSIKSDILTFIVRKFAHAFSYFILGLLVYRLISLYRKSSKEKIVYSLAICMLYACSDEIHQLFIFGRSGQITDVLIDSFGSLIGIIILFLVSNKNINKLRSIKDAKKQKNE